MKLLILPSLVLAQLPRVSRVSRVSKPVAVITTTSRATKVTLAPPFPTDEPVASNASSATTDSNSLTIILGFVLVGIFGIMGITMLRKTLKRKLNTEKYQHGALIDFSNNRDAKNLIQDKRITKPLPIYTDKDVNSIYENELTSVDSIDGSELNYQARSVLGSPSILDTSNAMQNYQPHFEQELHNQYFQMEKNAPAFPSEIDSVRYRKESYTECRPESIYSLRKGSFQDEYEYQSDFSKFNNIPRTNIYISNGYQDQQAPPERNYYPASSFNQQDSNMAYESYNFSYSDQKFNYYQNEPYEQYQNTESNAMYQSNGKYSNQNISNVYQNLEDNYQPDSFFEMERLVDFNSAYQESINAVRKNIPSSLFDNYIDTFDDASEQVILEPHTRAELSPIYEEELEFEYEALLGGQNELEQHHQSAFKKEGYCDGRSECRNFDFVTEREEALFFEKDSDEDQMVREPDGRDNVKHDLQELRKNLNEPFLMEEKEFHTDAVSVNQFLESNVHEMDDKNILLIVHADNNVLEIGLNQERLCIDSIEVEHSCEGSPDIYDKKQNNIALELEQPIEVVYGLNQLYVSDPFQDSGEIDSINQRRLGIDTLGLERLNEDDLVVDSGNQPDVNNLVEVEPPLEEKPVVDSLNQHNLGIDAYELDQSIENFDLNLIEYRQEIELNQVDDSLYGDVELKKLTIEGTLEVDNRLDGVSEIDAQEIASNEAAAASVEPLVEPHSHSAKFFVPDYKFDIKNRNQDDADLFDRKLSFDTLMSDLNDGNLLYSIDSFDK